MGEVREFWMRSELKGCREGEFEGGERWVVDIWVEGWLYVDGIEWGFVVDGGWEGMGWKEEEV